MTASAIDLSLIKVRPMTVVSITFGWITFGSIDPRAGGARRPSSEAT